MLITSIVMIMRKKNCSQFKKVSLTKQKEERRKICEKKLRVMRRKKESR